jgi:hypothetical protein
VLGPIAKSLVAKAALRHRTIETLSLFLAEEIPHEQDRIAFLRSLGVSSGTHRTPLGTHSFTPKPPGSPSGSQKVTPIDEKIIEMARRALAPSLGPISAMVVARTVKRVPSAEALRDALASEIADEKDRKIFLAAFQLP